MNPISIIPVGLFLFASIASGATIFSNNFDADPTGAFPTNWTLINNSKPTNATFAVSRSSEAPSAPMALQLANPQNGGYEVARFFPDVTLSTGVTLVLRYSLNVEKIPDGNASANTGFTICIGSRGVRVASGRGESGSHRVEGSQGRICTLHKRVDDRRGA